MIKSPIQSPSDQWKCSRGLQGALPQAQHVSSCHSTQALRSAHMCRPGRVSIEHPLGRCRGREAGVLPLPLTYAPVHLRKKKWKQIFCPRVLIYFHFFPLPCRPWGLCHAGVVPTSRAAVLPPASPSPPTVPLCHCCLGHCRDLLSSQSQDCIAGAAHVLQSLPNGAGNHNNKEQLLVGFFWKWKPELLILHENIAFYVLPPLLCASSGVWVRKAVGNTK